MWLLGINDPKKYMNIRFEDFNREKKIYTLTEHTTTVPIHHRITKQMHDDMATYKRIRRLDNDYKRTTRTTATGVQLTGHFLFSFMDYQIKYKFGNKLKKAFGFDCRRQLFLDSSRAARGVMEEMTIVRKAM